MEKFFSTQRQKLANPVCSTLSRLEIKLGMLILGLSLDPKGKFLGLGIEPVAWNGLALAQIS